jgi:hypothetical protein
MAGSVPTVKTRIIIDGGAEAKATLDGIKSSGEGMFRTLKSAGSALFDGGAAHAQVDRIGLRMLQTESTAHRLREALHVAHPILEEAGLGLSNLGGFARLAGTSLTGFGLALGGAIAIGLEKFQDQTTKAKKAIKDLGGSDKDFEGLSEGAKKLGFDLDTLAKGQENLATARGIPVKGGPKWVFTSPDMAGQSPKFTTTLAEAFTVGAGNIKDAQKQYLDFTAAIANSGTLDAGAVGTLSQGVAREVGATIPGFMGEYGKTPKQSLTDYVKDHRIDLPTFQMNVMGRRSFIEDQFKGFEQQPQLLEDSIQKVVKSLEGLAEQVGHVGLADALTKLGDYISTVTKGLTPESPIARGFAEATGLRNDTYAPQSASEAIAKGFGEAAPYSAAGAVLGSLVPGIGTALGAAVPLVAGASYQLGKYALQNGGQFLGNVAAAGGAGVDFGGYAGPQQPLNLNLPDRAAQSGGTYTIDLRHDGQSVGGGISDRALLDALRRLSADQQDSQGGRSPSWDR